MPVITREEVIPSPVANATVKKGFVNGVHKTYEIQANSGYVLHDKECDGHDLDRETMEMIPFAGFTRGICSERYDYDWDANPREFYCVLESDVPADHIFGGGNDHEIA